MRLLQHSVRNAFVICVLLGSAPVVAVSRGDYMLAYMTNTEGADFGVKVGTITARGASKVVERSTAFCATWWSITGEALHPSPSQCTATHVAALKPVCTIDGQPYSPGMNVRGLSFEIYQRYKDQTNHYDITDELPTGQIALYLGVKATNNGIHAGNLPGAYEEVNINCTYTESVLPIYSSSSVTAYGQHVGPIEYPFLFRVFSTLTVAVEQPSPVIGKLMTEFDAPFKMTVANALPSENLSMTWDVAAPCDSWSPSLRLPDGSVLGIHHADSGRLPSGTSTMTAKFTPTALGAFSCTGTLNVSLD